jgi:hypothetical protein
MHQPLPNQLYLEILTVQKIKNLKDTAHGKCDVETCPQPPDYRLHIPQRNPNRAAPEYKTFDLCTAHAADVINEIGLKIDQL